MPYYVYKIVEFPIRRLEKLEQHDAFRDASNSAKMMRGALAADERCKIKVIFGDNELHAEDMLNQVREAAPNPEDD
jgi:hypothetical protein